MEDLEDLDLEEGVVVVVVDVDGSARMSTRVAICLANALEYSAAVAKAAATFCSDGGPP